MPIILLRPALAGGPPSPTITTTSLPGGSVGALYHQMILVTSGTAPYVFSISAGALPSGLSLNAASGEISGTPLIAGGASFTVLVTDALAQTDDQGFSLTIAAAVVVVGEIVLLRHRSLRAVARHAQRGRR